RKSIFRLFLCLFVLAFANCAVALQNENTKLSVTIYNQGYAIVKEKLNINLNKGLNEYIMKDVPSTIVPASVKLYSEKNPNAITVAEQNYIFDLVDNYKLLNKYIDKNIGIQLKDKYFNGVLLSAVGNYILKTENEIVSIMPEKIVYINYPELPDGLITKPSLKWKIHSTIDGNQECIALYETRDISWHAEYVTLLKDDDKKLDLKCWVNINNPTSRLFKDAKLKLMAGDINRAASSKQIYRKKMNMMMAETADYSVPEFDSQSFFEFYLYTLNTTIDITANSEKQVSLFEANDIPAVKKYVYNASIDAKKVSVNLVFENSKKNNVGMAMPAGKIRVNKIDAKDNSIEFIGEDRIDHTPENDTITIKLGKAFDLKADRILKNSRRYSDRRWEETYEISLLNSKKEEVEIEVIENLASYANWRIFDNNFKFEKLSASQIKFILKIKPESRELLKYSVEYNN
ncbi:MAG TPA: hypothetical protein PLM75_06135, partial [bacterium]|nr:hypothetical protein [bacterium]